MRCAPSGDPQRASLLTNDRVGVVMSGGGARGAYEAAALLELGLTLSPRGEWPTVFCGASVGAINAASTASLSALTPEERLDTGLARWRDVIRPHVFGSLRTQLPRLAARYGADFVLPGHGRVHALLDPTPLGKSLHRWVDWQALHAGLGSGEIDAVAVLAAGAYSGTSTALWSGADRVTPTDGPVRYVRTHLGVDHVRAAAAIPALFPAVRLSEPGADGWFTDGSTRLRSPMRPGLDLGAERLVLVTTGSMTAGSARPDDTGPQPTVADAGATALHAMALDPIRDDVRAVTASGRPHIVLAPESPGEIGSLATEVLRSKQRTPLGAFGELALIDRFLGGESPLHGELMSFLLFDRDFIDELIRLGRRDARRWVSQHPDVWAVNADDADAVTSTVPE